MVVSVCESNVGEAGVGRYVYSTELGQGQREWWSLWSDGVLGVVEVGLRQDRTAADVARCNCESFSVLGRDDKKVANDSERG